MKQSKNGRVAVEIGALDFSMMIKEEEKITQTFNLDRRLAPEIEAGEQHCFSADIWALGMIA